MKELAKGALVGFCAAVSAGLTSIVVTVLVLSVAEKTFHLTEQEPAGLGVWTLVISFFVALIGYAYVFNKWFRWDRHGS